LQCKDLLLGNATDQMRLHIFRLGVWCVVDVAAL
jgi:hypothetical protein